jgi:hypothetical protein
VNFSVFFFFPFFLVYIGVRTHSYAVEVIVFIITQVAFG